MSDDLDKILDHALKLVISEGLMPPEAAAKTFAEVPVDESTRDYLAVVGLGRLLAGARWARDAG